MSRTPWAGLAALCVLAAGCHFGSSPPALPPCNGHCDPGHVTMRRLSATEYNNSVRDLLGDTTQPASTFPEDDKADGFDNNGDLLTTSTLFMEKAIAAAETVVDAAWQRESGTATINDFDIYDLPTTAMKVDGGSGLLIGAGQQVSAPVTLDQDSALTLYVMLSAVNPSSAARAVFLVDGQPFQSLPVAGAIPNFNPSPVQTAKLTAGTHQLAIQSQCAGDGGSDCEIIVTAFRWALQGPQVPFDRALVRICDPSTDQPCVLKIINQFGRKAWRRPLSWSETNKLMVLEQRAEFEASSSTQETPVVGALRTVLTAILSSPKFLFRVEVDNTPDDPTIHALSDNELATRMSYTLWASTPDAQLLDLADQGTLSRPEVYAAEIDRMLKSPLALGLAHDFAGQWLKTAPLATTQPDPKQFPNFDESLRAAMQAELDAYFTDFLSEDRPFHDLLDADFAFVNDRLAAHYGLPLPGSATVVKVPVPAGTLGGLLSRAGIMTATSHPDRTSPVRRGAWVLSALLCAAPPPPPPNIPALPGTGTQGGKTMKERLAVHRADPACASCHAAMDPIGLGLENFDAIGQWRTTDQGEPIDPSGTLSDGRSFTDPKSLAQLLKQDTRLNACVARKLWEYSLGRSLTDQDATVLAGLGVQWGQAGNRLGDLLKRLLNSRAFLARRGGP